MDRARYIFIFIITGCGGLEDPSNGNGPGPARPGDDVSWYEPSCDVDFDGQCDGVMDPVVIASSLDSPDIVNASIFLDSTIIGWQAGPGESAEGYLAGYGMTGEAGDWYTRISAMSWVQFQGRRWLYGELVPNEDVYRVNGAAPFEHCENPDEGFDCWADLDSQSMDDPYYVVDSQRRGSLCILVYLTQDPHTGEVVYDAVPAPDGCAFTGQ